MTARDLSRRAGAPALLALSLAAAASLVATPPASALPATQVPVTPDCAGPVPAAEPGTPEYLALDAANIYCTQERHLDQAQHPVTVLPVGDGGTPLPDAYRDPTRHDDVRFRYDTTVVEGLEVEVYRPCDAGSCADLPAGLDRFEAPYPAVISFHGGASNEKLHWWSSQMLAEAGYLVVSYKSAGVGPEVSEAQTLTDWLFARQDPLVGDFDGQRLGIAGHSGGGVVVSRFGQADERVDAVVSWDRAQSTVQPTDVPLRTPSLYVFADYNCQQVPVCQPEPSPEPPDPAGPGNKGEDFALLKAAGVDTLQIALRAALHLDWTMSEPSGNRYAEAMSVWYTTAWFDRYVKGSTDRQDAATAFSRLTARVYDDFADRRNISQGRYDPARAAAAGDPFAGNVPYAIEGMRVEDRLSYRYVSRCYLTEPGRPTRVESDDLRSTPCAASARRAEPRPGTEAPDTPAPANPPAPAPGALPATGASTAAWPALLLVAVAALRARRARGAGPG